MKPYFGIAKLSTLSLEELPGYPGITNLAGQKYFVEIYNSIKKDGVKSPIVVKQIKNVRHVLLGGARVRACKLLGITEVKAIIFSEEPITDFLEVKTYEELLSVSKTRKLVVTKEFSSYEL